MMGTPLRTSVCIIQICYVMMDERIRKLTTCVSLAHLIYIREQNDEKRQRSHARTFCKLKRSKMHILYMYTCIYTCIRTIIFRHPAASEGLTRENISIYYFYY